MAVVNPRQIQHIKSIQPDFEFRVRKLQPSLDIASEDDLFKVDDAKPKPVARQGSLQLGSSLRSARRADQPMATMAPPSSSGSSSSSQTNSLSLEDRRLLARAKWLLKRLLIETDEEKQSLSEREHITDELDEHEEDHYHALRAAQQKGPFSLLHSPRHSHLPYRSECGKSSQELAKRQGRSQRGLLRLKYPQLPQRRYHHLSCFVLISLLLLVRKCEVSG
jgi:hypothetical protein